MAAPLLVLLLQLGMVAVQDLLLVVLRQPVAAVQSPSGRYLLLQPVPFLYQCPDALFGACLPLRARHGQ